MYDCLKQEVEQLIAAMKQNPTHIPVSYTHLHSTYVTKSNLDTEFDGQTILAKSYEAGTETVTLSNNKKVLVETEQVRCV